MHQIKTSHLIHAKIPRSLHIDTVKEEVMSCVGYKTVDTEESITEKQADTQRLKPFVVPSSRVRPGDEVARRVAEVLDFELAQGSMPT
jgi:hypothetical protein